MWEAVARVLTDENTWQVLIFAAVLIAAVMLAVRSGILSVRTGAVRLGNGEAERNVIRQQVEWSHLYIMSLRAEIESDDSDYNSYFIKYILERCFDKVVEWITFNHLNTNNEYIEIKQEEIWSLVCGLGVRDEFKTPEFKRRICGWTRELIEHLVRIREVYNQSRGGRP